MKINPKEIGSIEITGLTLRVYSKRNTLMFEEAYGNEQVMLQAFKIVNDAWTKELQR